MKTYKGNMPPLKANQSVAYGATSQERIEILYTLAEAQPEKEFIIPYNALSNGLPNNLTLDDLAHMFACRSFTPVNIILEESFCELVDQHKMKRVYSEGKAVD